MANVFDQVREEDAQAVPASKGNVFDQVREEEGGMPASIQIAPQDLAKGIPGYRPTDLQGPENPEQLLALGEIPKIPGAIASSLVGGANRLINGPTPPAPGTMPETIGPQKSSLRSVMHQAFPGVFGPEIQNPNGPVEGLLPMVDRLLLKQGPRGEQGAIPFAMSTEPFVDLPKFAVHRDDTVTGAALKESANLALGLADFFQSPAGISTAGLGTAFPKAVPAYFALDISKTMFEQAPQLYAEWPKMTNAEKAKAFVDFGGQALMVKMLAAHGFKSREAAFQGMEPPENATPKQLAAWLEAEQARATIKPDLMQAGPFHWAANTLPVPAPLTTGAGALSVGPLAPGNRENQAPAAPFRNGEVARPEPPGLSLGDRLALPALPGSRGPAFDLSAPGSELRMPPGARPGEAPPELGRGPQVPANRVQALTPFPELKARGEVEQKPAEVRKEPAPVVPAAEEAPKVLFTQGQRVRAGSIEGKLVIHDDGSLQIESDKGSRFSVPLGDLKAVEPGPVSVTGTGREPVDSGMEQDQGKEPWQMTREQFGDSQRLKAEDDPSLPPAAPGLFGALDAFAKQQNRSPYNPDLITPEAVAQLRAEGLLAGGPKNPRFTDEGRAKLEEWRRMERERALAFGDKADLASDKAMDVHRASVEQAMREGKPVPAEVLADYPDLRKSAVAQPKPIAPSGISPGDKGITPEEKAFRATAQGQKAMASRASRIGTLLQMNEAIRKLDPQEAYDRRLIEGLPDSQIDQWQEDLRQNWNRLKAKAEPAATAPATAPAANRDWDLFQENLADDLDSFSPARDTGRINYELADVAQRFVDYAKADKSGKPLDRLVSDFAKTDEASPSQIRKLAASVKSVLGKESPPSFVPTQLAPLSEFEQATLGRLNLKYDQGRQMTVGERNQRRALKDRQEAIQPQWEKELAAARVAQGQVSVMGAGREPVGSTMVEQDQAKQRLPQVPEDLIHVEPSPPTINQQRGRIVRLLEALEEEDRFGKLMRSDISDEDIEAMSKDVASALGKTWGEVLEWDHNEMIRWLRSRLGMIEQAKRDGTPLEPVPVVKQPTNQTLARIARFADTFVDDRDLLEQVEEQISDNPHDVPQGLKDTTEAFRKVRDNDNIFSDSPEYAKAYNDWRQAIARATGGKAPEPMVVAAPEPALTPEPEPPAPAPAPARPTESFQPPQPPTMPKGMPEGAEPEPVELEHPKAGTPEALSLREKSGSAAKVEDELQTKLRLLEEEENKAGYGTKRRDQAAARAQKAREAIWDFQKANADLHRQAREMRLEHLATEGHWSQKWGATVELLKARAERIQKQSEALREAGKRTEADEAYWKAKSLGERVRAVGEEGYKVLTAEASRQLQELGATKDEADFEAGQSANMQMSYPGMKTMQELAGRMRAIEGERTKVKVDAEAKALMDEFGVLVDDKFRNRIKTALPNAERAREIIAETRKEYQAQKDAEDAKTAKAEEAATEKRAAEMEQARALEAQGKLHWVRSGVKSGTWHPVEGKAVLVKGTPERKFFVHKTGVGEWSVTEESTGSIVTKGKTQGGAITNASQQIARVGKAKLDELIKRASEGMPPKPDLKAGADLAVSGTDGKNGKNEEASASGDLAPVSSAASALAKSEADLFPDLQGKAPTLERVRRAIVEAEKVYDQTATDAQGPDVPQDSPLYDRADLAQKRLEKLRALGSKLEQQALEAAKSKGQAPLSEFEQATLGRLNLKYDQRRQMTVGERNQRRALKDRQEALDAAARARQGAEVEEKDPAGPQEARASAETPDHGLGSRVRKKWASATDDEPPFGSEAGFFTLAPLKDLLDRVGPAVRASVDAVRSATRENFNIRKASDYRRSVLNWSAKLQRSFGEAADAQREIRGKVKDRVRREGITNWIQAGGDDAVLRQRAADTAAWRDPVTGKPHPQQKQLVAGYEAALSLTPEEHTIANEVKAAFDDLLNRGMRYDVIKSFKDNYVTQIWDLGRSPKGQGGSRMLKDKFRFSKASTFATFFDGEQAGYVPKTKDISALLPVYLHEMNSVIAARQLVEQMSKGVASDGRPLLAPRGVGVAVDGPHGKATLVLPDVPKEVSVGPRGSRAKVDTNDYVFIEKQPALHEWVYAAKDSAGNPVFHRGDMVVHPEVADRFKNALGRSAIAEWYNSKTTAGAAIPKALVKGLDMAQSETKRTMLGVLTPFHQVQEGTHAVGHKVNPFFNNPKIDLVNNAAQMDAARHGLMLLPDRASERQFMEGFRQSGLVSHLPGIGPLADHYSNYLFHEYIPGIKYKTYQAILERNSARYADDIAAGKATLEDVKLLSAEQANAAYGHLNYADLGRNPTMMHLARLGLLAPDFLEARARFAGQAIKGLSGGKIGREQLVALATLALAQATLSWTSAKLTGGQWDEKDPFSFHLGNQKFTMRSVPEDLYRAVKDHRAFWYARLNPLIGRGVLQYLSGTDWRGQKVGPGETTKELMQQPIPLILRPLLGIGNTPLSGWEQLAGAVGLKISRYSAVSEIAKQAHAYMANSTDPKLRAEEERYQKTTLPDSDYKPLREALERGDLVTARKEYAKLRQARLPAQISNAIRAVRPFTGSRAGEAGFESSLDVEGRRLYEDALRERQRIYDNFDKLRDSMPQE